MTGQGVHAEVEVVTGAGCRIGNMPQKTEEISSISRSTMPSEDSVTVDFTAESGTEFNSTEEVFHYDDKTVHRFECKTGTTPSCPCEFVESRGCPVRSFRTTENALIVQFVARDIRNLREIVVGLREQFPDVSLRRLTRSQEPEANNNLVLIDRDTLTERQQEVLETAHEMGYFGHPKDANATEVADALDINRSTFAEHLSAAQSKLLDSILEF
ncbi:DNA-binding protein [Halogeometricum borinquense]|uniref:DNA-binding protein n=1 Tax=Halogeometricum borinquense TaxID=60847 RepID=A0A6C0UN55_9EURY|nr:helix-turn-helix domain-containing protein [Halogeometricum borinquense]QIB74358.1 DNA-binding protein [Halogeometricum borinquense]